MSCVRKNTLVVDFSVLPVRPEVSKVEQFLENAIKVNLADVKCIQLHHTRNCAYIEMKDHETALQYENAYNLKRVIVCNDRPFKIPVYVDSEAVTVRVCDLPPSMLHATVGDYMMRYGEVISIQNERWKNYFSGVYNGVRVLQMRLKQSIPSFITINDEIATVHHLNQIKTCRWCTKPAHPEQKCSEVSKTVSTASATTTSPPNDNKFSEADFPPIDNKQSTEPSTEAVPLAGKRALAENESNTKIVPRSTDQAMHLNTNNNDNAGDDDDGNNDSSSSPEESCDGTNKRRLATKRGKEKKKICATQGSHSDCDSNLSANFIVKK